MPSPQALNSFQCQGLTLRESTIENMCRMYFLSNWSELGSPSLERVVQTRPLSHTGWPFQWYTQLWKAKLQHTDLGDANMWPAPCLTWYWPLKKLAHLLYLSRQTLTLKSQWGNGGKSSLTHYDVLANTCYILHIHAERTFITHVCKLPFVALVCILKHNMCCSH